jgi:hypothetical protein
MYCSSKHTRFKQKQKQMAFGKVGKIYQTAKHLLGKGREHALNASRALGKGFTQVQHAYGIARNYALKSASKLDNKLGTGGAARAFTESGIRAAEKSPYGTAVRSGLDEVQFQNRRAQDLLGAFGQ